MAIAVNAAKARLKKNQLAVGIGVRLVRNVDIIKVMKAAGFDWLFLDLEHGVMGIENAAEICVAAQDSGIAPIVRVPYGELAMATRVLDGGALGIVIPHVDTAEEAREIADRQDGQQRDVHEQVHDNDGRDSSDHRTRKVAVRVAVLLGGIGASGTAGAAGQVIVFGKRITDRLTLGYEQGLSIAANAVRLEYALTNTLTLRAEAGMVSGVGVYYRRAFD